MDTEKLKKAIHENGLTIQSVSKEIGMNPSTFYRKIKQKGINFSIGEMHALQELLHISAEEAADIFLSQNSQ